MPGLITCDFQLLIMSPVTRDSCPTHACPSSTINYPPVNKSSGQKEKKGNCSCSQARLAYIARCVLVGCRASYQIKKVRWFFFPTRVQFKKTKNSHTVCWWSCVTPHSAAALIEHWQGKLSSVSCSVYTHPPRQLHLHHHRRHIIDSVEASGAAWCLARSGADDDRRDFWSLIVWGTKARGALLERWGQSCCVCACTNTQRCVQQTYKKKKKKKKGVKGERQQAWWHVKLPRWCIA